MTALREYVTLAFASCFFLTYPLVRLARIKGSHMTGAGFIGTLAGLATARCLPQDPARCALFLLGALFVSVAVSEAAEGILGEKDDQRIVIDEWAGYLFAIALLPPSRLFLVGAFVLFRLMDTFKPLFIKRLAKLPGGWGVVMDDVAAGILTNAILHFLPHT